ncbi:MAG: M23 family metallopeptidase [Bacteroides sp.]|nr:M23 family metallopeptidase [Bacteroides sp.]
MSVLPTVRGHAQADTLQAPISFASPVERPLLLSGNFGEIRTDHFHGGLDFKTGGVSGKPIRALADGYLSRIRVTHGSGLVLDVVYDNGYTAINRHLSAFMGDVARRVEALQYDQENWEVTIEARPGEYPVKAGEVIALGGNTGYSFGPHLHMELIETATGDYVDPLPFFAGRLDDTTPPRAEGLMLFPRRGRGTVNGKSVPQRFPLHPKESVTAWGEIGFGIKAYDYMNGVHNRYGVHTVILEVDGREVCRSVVDRFSYDEHRYINSWTEGQYMKSFIEPGNRLRLLHAANDNRGVVTIDEERPYRLCYTLSDALGNTTRVAFTIHGKKTETAVPEHRAKHFLHWDRPNTLQDLGLTLHIPRGLLYDDVPLDYALTVDSAAVAYTYRLHTARVPLHDYAELSIGLRRHPLADSTKYYVARVDERGRKHSVGGRYEGGFMKARIRELGTYTVAVDTLPPRLTPIGQNSWGRSGRITVKAKDAETGITSYRGEIDGRFVLFGRLNAIDGRLVCRLDPQRLKRGGKHRLQLTVTDECGNTTVKHYDFIW